MQEIKRDSKRQQHRNIITSITNPNSPMGLPGNFVLNRALPAMRSSAVNSSFQGQQSANSGNIHQLSQHAGQMGVGGPPGPDCAGCQKPIRERYLLKALDQLWHEDCLKCACCDCRLGEVGSTLFTKTNLILCKRDYLRLFGTTGLCSACNKAIPAFEMVMRAKGNVYHLECFACQQCSHRFCVGDKFYLHENKILCEYDYEERLVFANLPYTYNSLAQMKRQTQELEQATNVTKDDGSSGYGSGDSPFDNR